MILSIPNNSRLRLEWFGINKIISGQMTLVSQIPSCDLLYYSRSTETTSRCGCLTVCGVAVGVSRFRTLVVAFLYNFVIFLQLLCHGKSRPHDNDNLQFPMRLSFQLMIFISRLPLSQKPCLSFIQKLSRISSSMTNDSLSPPNKSRRIPSRVYDFPA